MEKNANILIVGHDDIIEKSLFAYLTKSGYTNVHSSSKIALDATIQPSVYKYFQEQRPQYVFLGSTRSGGIEANRQNSGKFLYHNLESQNNIIYAAHKFQTKKLLYFAGSCVYPKECPQPMKPEHLLTGLLEPTSEAYSIAKIAGIKLCQAYRAQYGFNAIVAVPATVCGPQSSTDEHNAHVMGALMGKFIKAVKNNEATVTVWGSGKPRREFIHADDFVRAAELLMNSYDNEETVHIGTGEDISISELAQMIAQAVGFSGKIVYDTSKPDGAMQKLLDNSKLKSLGWTPRVRLLSAIEQMVKELK